MKSIGFIKTIGWVYLIAFALMHMLNAVSATLWSDFSGTDLVLIYLPLVTVFALAAYLKRNKRLAVLASVGAISLLPPLSDAHKFRELEYVTPVMYLFLLPMFLIMGFIIYEKIRGKT
ncbi:MAG: hypothetical protein AB2657_02410 [Candidatus Thiodiazotropha endolucinida]